jgi:hypothetical protein
MNYSIGDLIDELQKCDGKKIVILDNVLTPPGDFYSYRGYYEDMAISEGRHMKTVKEFIHELKDMCGESLEGWKGGHFSMDVNTRTWVAGEGELSTDAIVGVKEEGVRVLLLVKYVGEG